MNCLHCKFFIMRIVNKENNHFMCCCSDRRPETMNSWLEEDLMNMEKGIEKEINLECCQME